MASRLKNLFSIKNLLATASTIAIIALFFSYASPYIHPKTFSILPFFGLAYWVILLSTLLLTAIWFFTKSKWKWLMLFAILIGGTIHFRTFSFGFDESAGTNELHVMSYNVRLFDLYNAISNRDYDTRNQIFSYVKERNPDVICFQEFFHQDNPTNFVTRDSILRILNIVDYHERFAIRKYVRQNFGIALFSKYPIIEKGYVNFSGTGNSFNYCIYADIVKNKDTVRVYNMHLQSIHFQKDDYALFNNLEDYPVAEQSSGAMKLLKKMRDAYFKRADQAKLVTEHMKNAPYPIVACGDFNDTPMSYTYNQFNKQLTDAFRNTSFGLGKTYAGNIPAGRIDYIFHDDKLGSREFEIQKQKLSDHYAIDCKVILR